MVPSVTHREVCHKQATLSFIRQDNRTAIRRLPAYLAEARYALRLGETSGVMQWHFRFEDYALTYILDQAQQEISWEAIAHPAFKKLLVHDEQHGTELLATARCFMECKYNVSRAAQCLHIHRSSMLARLERIKDVAAIDWDDWSERIHLALSFCFAEADSSAKPY